MALVIAADAVARVGEPDRSVGVFDHIVGTIEPTSFIRSCKHPEGAVVLGPGHSPPAVLAGHKSALSVDRATVREASWRKEHIGTLAHLVVTQHPVVGDVAEQHEASCGVIGGSFEPATAGKESRDRPISACTGKAPIKYLELCRDV